MGIPSRYSYGAGCATLSFDAANGQSAPCRKRLRLRARRKVSWDDGHPRRAQAGPKCSTCGQLLPGWAQTQSTSHPNRRPPAYVCAPRAWLLLLLLLPPPLAALVRYRSARPADTLDAPPFLPPAQSTPRPAHAGGRLAAERARNGWLCRRRWRALRTGGAVRETWSRVGAAKARGLKRSRKK